MFIGRRPFIPSLLAVACAAFFQVYVPARAADGLDAEALDRAVSVLFEQPRHSEGEAPDAQALAAWKTLRLAGAPGAEALKRKLAALPAVPAADADDAVAFFRLGAANLLFQIAGLDEADAIAQQWRLAGPARAEASRLVYGCAFRAARLDDPRAYPMLAALLDDTADDVRMTRGSDIAFEWPDTHVLLWAAAGEAAEPALLAVLADEASTPEALASAAWVAAKSANVKAVPALRRLAARRDFDAAKGAAVEALGIFGYPEDFDGLRRELAAALALPADDTARSARVMACVNALIQFGDSRAAADFLPLVRSHDPALRQHGRDLFPYLLTPEGLDALRAAVAGLKGAERADADVGIGKIFAGMRVPANEYDAADADAKAQWVQAYRTAQQARYEAAVAEGEEAVKEVALTELMAAVAEQGTTALAGDYAWIEPRHFLAKAEAADRPLFLAARQTLAHRLSDTVAADLDVMTSMLVRLARAEYRTPAGFGTSVRARD